MESIATTALDHARLSTQVDLHPLAFNLLFIHLGSDDLSNLSSWHNRTTLATLGVNKENFLALFLVLKALLECMSLETANMISVEAHGLHKHTDVLLHFILRRDGLITVATLACRICFIISCRSFFGFFKHRDVTLLFLLWDRIRF